MWKWVAGAVVVFGVLVCAGAAGGGAWWWWTAASAERAAEEARLAAEEAAAQEVRAAAAAQGVRVERLAAARLAAAAGDHAAAVDAFSDVLDGEPAHAEALLGRGRAYAQLERYDLAEEDLRAATRAAPADPAGWESLGWVLGRMGRDADAVDALDRRIALGEADPGPWRDRANARYRAGDVAGARADAARACALGLADGCTLEERIVAATRR